ncbi:MAG: hypothetical protein AAB869_03435, partial [Patescibacteria group bacterium]
MAVRADADRNSDGVFYDGGRERTRPVPVGDDKHSIDTPLHGPFLVHKRNGLLDSPIRLILPRSDELPTDNNRAP